MPIKSFKMTRNLGWIKWKNASLVYFFFSGVFIEATQEPSQAAQDTWNLGYARPVCYGPACPTSTKEERMRRCGRQWPQFSGSKDILITEHLGEAGPVG